MRSSWKRQGQHTYTSLHRVPCVLVRCTHGHEYVPCVHAYKITAVLVKSARTICLALLHVPGVQRTGTQETQFTSLVVIHYKEQRVQLQQYVVSYTTSINTSSTVYRCSCCCYALLSASYYYVQTQGDKSHCAFNMPGISEYGMYCLPTGILLVEPLLLMCVVPRCRAPGTASKFNRRVHARFRSAPPSRQHLLAAQGYTVSYCCDQVTPVWDRRRTQRPNASANLIRGGGKEGQDLFMVISVGWVLGVIQHIGDT